MKSSFNLHNLQLDPQSEPNFDSGFDSKQDSALFARAAMSSRTLAARAGVVNRTHRVIRERAKAMQQKRSRDRSMMVPLMVCSVLLILSVLAVWTGLYQYEAAETAQDVAGLATTDANNHFMVVLLWFVPVSAAVLATIWVSRSRTNFDDEAR